MKLENHAYKLDGIGVGSIRSFSFSSDSAYDYNTYDPVKTRISKPQAEVADSANHIGSS